VRTCYIISMLSCELVIIQGNISGGNQPLCANYGNFNRSHTMLIQQKTYRRWEGWCAKLIRGGRDDLQKNFCKSPLPPPMSPPLAQHRATLIEVSIVCTEGLVSTWYVQIIQSSNQSVISALGWRKSTVNMALVMVCPPPRYPTLLYIVKGAGS
jgi:hypothetical protein